MKNKLKNIKSYVTYDSIIFLDDSWSKKLLYSVVCYNSVKVCSCLSCCIILISVELKEYLKIVESR